jgi:hypothetical protein
MGQDVAEVQNDVTSNVFFFFINVVLQNYLFTFNSCRAAKGVNLDGFMHYTLYETGVCRLVMRRETENLRRRERRKGFSQMR